MPACLPACRRVLRLNQDPNSEHLGTTVWDVGVSSSPLPARRRCRRTHVRAHPQHPPSHHGTPGHTQPGRPAAPQASIVLAKYLEKHARRGDLSRPKVRGKRAIELGAGMGLGGMAFAMMGACPPRVTRCAQARTDQPWLYTHM